MSPEDRRHVEQYWSADLACAPADFHQSGIAICVDRSAYQGAVFLRTGPACVVSLPEGWLEHARDTLTGRDPEEVFRPRALAAIFVGAVDRIIGPAYLGYLAAGVSPKTDPEVRRVEGMNSQLRRLQQVCDPTEWAHAGADTRGSTLFGLLQGDELVCLGSSIPWGEPLEHLGILTHPLHRGRGLARRVVSTMAASALERQRVPQYRTLCANTPSWRVGQAVGFEEWAQTLAVRLRHASPSRKPEAPVP